MLSNLFPEKLAHKHILSVTFGDSLMAVYFLGYERGIIRSNRFRCGVSNGLAIAGWSGVAEILCYKL
jgi:hypothetical protein